MRNMEQQVLVVWGAVLALVVLLAGMIAAGGIYARLSEANF